LACSPRRETTASGLAADSHGGQPDPLGAAAPGGLPCDGKVPGGHGSSSRCSRRPRLPPVGFMVGGSRMAGGGLRLRRCAGRPSGGAGAGARLAMGRAPPRRTPFIGRGASGSLGAHAKDSRRRPCGLRRSHVQGGLRLGPDGLRGRARVWAGAGLGRAWWATACEATAAGEGNEGARADFGSWAAERRWAAGRGCWAASCPRIEGATEDFRDWQKGLMG
jgi:hypothetical protein